MFEFKHYYNAKKKNKKAVLTDFEKRVVVSLRKHNVRDQDITYILNIGRETTLNHARIGEVRGDIVPLSDEELIKFQEKQMSWDFKTGLNPYNKIDNIVIKSKNAFIQAVSVFNSPKSAFQIETFFTLVNISWLYLFQAYCEKNNISYINKDKTTQSLKYMIYSNTKFLQSVNLSKAEVKNIDFVIEIRDFITHKGDYNVIPNEVLMKLQANCINYNNILKKLFGNNNGLENIFSLALQFASISLEQSKLLISNKSNNTLSNFVKNYEKNIEDNILNSETYQFTITYITINERNKNKADVVRYITPTTDNNFENVKEILIKEVSDDAKYKYRLTDIVKILRVNRNEILDLIVSEKLRKDKKSNNLKLLKPYIFGSMIQWKYTDEFLKLCREKLTNVTK